MNSDIFIPARLESTRLPLKHLKIINGKPLIKHLVNRLKTAKKFRHIIICTTNSPFDNPLVNFLEKEGIRYFRGSKKDILVRFLDASHHFKTDIIIDVEGDKIYTDPVYVDSIITQMENSDLDFIIGNNSKRKFDPYDHLIHGLIPAGIRVSALKKICELKKTTDTETGYREFFTNSKLIKSKYLIPNLGNKIPKNIRLTIDYEEDLDLANEVFKELGDDFNSEDILKLFVRRPGLLKITKSIVDKWTKDYKANFCDVDLKKD